MNDSLAYNHPDIPFAIEAIYLPDLIKVIECVIECHDFFDPVILDVDIESAQKLLSVIKATQRDGSPNVKISLSKGMSADLCSCIMQVIDGYSSLSPKNLNVSKTVLLHMQSLAFGDKQIDIENEG